MVDSKLYFFSNEKFVFQVGIKVLKEYRYMFFFVIMYVRSYVYVNVLMSFEKVISEQFFSLKFVCFFKIEIREDEGFLSRLFYLRYFKINFCFKSFKRVIEYLIFWCRFFLCGQFKQFLYIFFFFN